ncbi:EAL domain-containing protein [Bacillus sp. HMF5848]|uniref:EAL domain-containing protein n=1 Tax=Bacillus sp. HMF5848 TaxID=2495421 RepID=UPI000F770A1A|nr:EAL domain-containing protein [Bacillus sp. HMF5848]RSK28811.1 EAL domain-containing protein [Bacillus sp. HMF5848]
MSATKERQYIRNSNKLSSASGISPEEIVRPSAYLTNNQLVEKRELYKDILEVIRSFTNKFLNSLKGTPILLMVSDEESYILEIMGDQSLKDSLEEAGFQPGAHCSLQVLGTNVVSLALQENEPVQVVGDDHYNKHFHRIASYGSSYHYTDIDRLLGSLSFITTVEYENPLFLSMLSNFVDAVERELLLRKRNRQLNIMNQIMLSRTRNAIIITDADGKVTEYNHFAEVISGFTREEIIGRDIFASPRTGSYFKEVIHNEKIYKDVEMHFYNNNGERMICLFDAQPIYENDVMIGAFAQLRNITERYLMEEKYNYLAYHDELTGLPNRRYFHSELEKVMKSDECQDTALLLVDLDQFKNINDTFGHSQGDRVLIEVTERIRGCIGQEDMLARISGDEFIILLKNNGKDGETIAEQVVQQFKEPFTINHNQFHLTGSIGVTIYSDDVKSLEDYIVQADTAMYRAKSQGKNCYVVYTPEMYKDTSEELLLEHDLRMALEQDQFELHYQAQVNSQTGSIIGVEALIRWNHPERGVIPPYKFIPLAERTGLIVPIGEWVIERACLQNKEWISKGLPPIKVSVNLSIQQFLKQNIVDTIAAILKRTEFDPQYLELEITESMAMDFSYAEATINQLRDLGVQISMDDFGTGYSSLSYLKNFAINSLKIDKSFVTDILIDENDAKIVGTIIAMADGLGIKVIAEGVEDEGQLHFLSNQNCFEVQGYYFMKPTPAHEFEERYLQLTEEFKRKSTVPKKKVKK